MSDIQPDSRFDEKPKENHQIDYSQPHQFEQTDYRGNDSETQGSPAPQHKPKKLGTIFDAIEFDKKHVEDEDQKDNLHYFCISSLSPFIFCIFVDSTHFAFI